MTTKATNARDALDQARCLVIKIGSSLLIDSQTGQLRRAWLESLARDVSNLKEQGKEVILVSSGAIGLGWAKLGYKRRPTRLDQLQASAAVGQIHLARAYNHAFEAHHHTTAQLLITLADFEERARYLNARATVRALIEQGAIPVFNENDTVATNEIRFGDNDRLAARIAGLVGSDLLVLLSDVDGLYTADPRNNSDACHIPHVASITKEIAALAGAAGGQFGSGGMITKIGAAQIATSGGTAMIIADGQKESALDAVKADGKATLFDSNDNPLAVRKRWLRGMMAPNGFLHLDQGAINAIKADASLLPVGVTRVDGVFDRGDLVAFISQDGDTIGQGLTAYDHKEADKLKGHAMTDAEQLIGYGGRPALVHRDDLVIF